MTIIDGLDFAKASLVSSRGARRVYLVADEDSGQTWGLLKRVSQSSSTDVLRLDVWGLTALSCPLLPQIFDIIRTEDGHPCALIEAVTGEPLWLDGLDAGQFGALVRELCGFLGVLHAQGMVAVDLDPSGMCWQTGSRLRLIDFGAIQCVGTLPGLPHRIRALAPEICQGGPAEVHSDLYALGVLIQDWLEKEFSSDGNRSGDGRQTAGAAGVCVESGFFLPLETWREIASGLLDEKPIKRQLAYRHLLKRFGVETEQHPSLGLGRHWGGRSELLAQLETQLQAVRNTRTGEYLHIGGGAMVGKSHTLERLAMLAAAAGFCVLRGQGGDSHRPYSAVVTALEDALELMGSGDAVPSSRMRDYRMSLAPVLEGLSLPQGYQGLPPDRERERILSAALSCLLDLATRKGLVFLLDDWHEADLASHELVAQLIQRVSGVPLFIVTTGVMEEVAIKGQNWPLSALTSSEWHALVEVCLGPHIALPVLEEWYEAAQGIPGLLWPELARCVEVGRLRLGDHGWIVVDASVSEREGVDASLSGDLSRLVHDLAFGGQRFPLECVYRLVADWPVAQVHAAIMTLVRQRYLLPLGDFIGWQQASQRRALQAAIPVPERQRHFDRVALAIAPPYSSQPVGAALVVWASYLSRGTKRQEAVFSILQAARCLGSFGLTAMALQLLDALSVPASCEWAVDVQRDYDVLYAGLLIESGAAEAALARLHAGSAPQAGGTGELLGFERQLCLARAYAKLGDFQTSGQYFIDAELSARRVEQLTVMLQALLGLGVCHLALRRPDLAKHVLSEALDLGRASGNLFVVGQSLLLLGRVHLLDLMEPARNDETERAIQFLEQAVAVHEAMGDRRGLLESLSCLGGVQLRVGRLKASDRHYVRALEIAQSLGARHPEIDIRLALSRVSLQQGNCLWAWEYANTTLDMIEEPDETPLRLAAQILGIWSRQMLGRLEGLAEEVESVMLAVNALPDVEQRNSLMFDFCEVFLRLGLVQEARACLDDVEARSSDDTVRYGRLCASVLLKRQRWLNAIDLYDVALQHATHRGLSLEIGAILLGMGEAFWRLGRRDEAEHSLNRAQKIAETLAALPLLTQCHLLRGALTLSLEDAVLAERQFNRAEILAGRLNLPDELAAALYRRSCAEGITPHSKLLRSRAQALMVRLKDRIAVEWRSAFLADRDRQDVLQAVLHQQAVEQPAGTAMADRVLSLQRVVSLQHQELEFVELIANSHDATFAVEQALSILLELSFAERAELLEVGDREWRLLQSQHPLTTLEPIDDDWALYRDFLQAALDSHQCQYQDEWVPLEADDARAIVAIPLTEGGRQQVILLLGHPGIVKALGRPEQQFIKVLARHLAHTLTRIDLQQELKERSNRLEMLYALTTAVNTTQSMGDVLELVLRLALEITHAERALIMLLNPQNQLECEAIRPTPLRVGDAVLYSKSICQRVLNEGKALWTDDAHARADFNQHVSIQNLNIRTVMCVPLRIRQRKIGVLYVDSRLALGRFNDQDLTVLQTIGDQASVAIENARLNEASAVDETTGLLVLSIFERRLKEEYLRCCRYGGVFSTLILVEDQTRFEADALEFEQVGIANVLKTNLRDHLDLATVAQDGHFIVLLPETAAAGALICAERIRKAIHHTTVSIGVATFESRQDTTDNLMQSALLACHAAHQMGGDRVHHVKEMESNVTT